MLVRIREYCNGPCGRRLVGQTVEILFSLLMVAGVTAAIGVTLLFYTIEHVTILYLIPVLVAALRWGIIPAVCAAAAGVAAPAFFFYPPIYDFHVRNPDQIIDLVLFVIVAVVTGQLGVTVRKAKMRVQAESLRDALIGSVSHELRTPLASIVGSASILAQAPAIEKDEHLSSLVGVLQKEAERLNSDIQNLLDATRISSEGIRPNWQWVDLEDIINGALARKQGLLTGYRIVLCVADDLPLAFIDATLVESAIGQLIENAAKYSPPGAPISISAAQSGSTIGIKIRDEGAGLSTDELGRIFERFYRSPRHASNVSGSGLGLWIARSLVAACGGSIRAFSDGPDRGTTMTINLPIKSQPAADEEVDD